MIKSIEPQSLIFAAETEDGEQVRQILQQAGWTVTIRDSAQQDAPPFDPSDNVLIVMMENIGCEKSAKSWHVSMIMLLVVYTIPFVALMVVGSGIINSYIVTEFSSGCY